MNFIETLFDLKSGDFSKVIIALLINVVLAIVIAVVGFWLTGILTRVVNRILRKSDTDAGLTSFLSSFLSMALKVMVVISAITQLGVEMTSFLTLLGAAGIAIGLAFSGTLSNFAGGIMILVLKPFKIGDTIEALGEQGVVYEIQIFNTYLKTPDNKILIFPNGPLANGTIINYTREVTRRVEWTFVFAHSAEIQSIEQVLSATLKANKGFLQKPEPIVGIQKISNEGIEVKVRCWVQTADYSALFFKGQQLLIEASKEAKLPFAEA